GGRHEPLQRAARRRAELEPIDDVEPELDQACAEVEPSTAILHQVAAGVKRAHEAVRAAARESKPLAYLGDRETLRLAGQQLEDVERPVGRLNRYVFHRPRLRRRKVDRPQERSPRTRKP